MSKLKTRISCPEQEVSSSQATSEGLREDITMTTKQVVGYNGKEQTHYQYEILGEIYTTNKELTQLELDGWFKVIKEKR
tara:strand:+ start:1219 stop:1455 length:237 start_codon:yes stop_codon:yes gene_type:complete